MCWYACRASLGKAKAALVARSRGSTYRGIDFGEIQPYCSELIKQINEVVIHQPCRRHKFQERELET